MISDEGGATERWMVISVSGAGCPYGPCLTWYTKLNSRWIIKVNMKDKTIKLLENNIRQYLYHLWVGKDFLDQRQKVLMIRKVDKSDYIKIEDF